MRKEYPPRKRGAVDRRKRKAKRLRGMGLSFRQIAERMGVDESTVRYYVDSE